MASRLIPEMAVVPETQAPKGTHLRFLLHYRVELLWAVLLISLSLAATEAGWRFAGWPINHEFFAHFERVETFRRAYATGDWFPLWTPFSNNGHGSPMPFFYHRLFNTVGGVLALALGSTYWGVKVAVSLIMLAGAVGMDRASRFLGASRIIRLTAISLFVFSPYVTIDWLTRGSTAEFTAFMLAPWLVEACMQASRGQPVGGRLGLVVALMYYAHNAVCYFAILIPLAAAIIAMRTAADSTERLARARVFLRSGLVFLLVAGPYLLAIALTGRLFNLAALNHIWSPLKTMRPLLYYLVDSSFVWGQQWQGLSVEIGLPLIVATVVVAVTLCIGRIKVNVSTIVLLLSTLSFYMFLQVPASGFIYTNVPGAFFLGFPWRLLALIVTEGIVLLALLATTASASATWRRRFTTVVIAGAAIWQAGLSFRAQDVKYGRYRRGDIEQHLADLDVPTVGEYLPAKVGGLYRAPARTPFIAWTNCENVRTSGTDPGKGSHLSAFTLEASSRDGCTIRTNQFFTPFLRVDGAPSRPSDTTEQTIELAMPPGRQTATISPRGLWGVIAATLRR